MKKPFVLRVVAFVLAHFFAPFFVQAHPMPSSAVELTVLSKKVVFELKMPLLDFETAFGQAVATGSGDSLFRRKMNAYFVQHVRIQSADGRFWPLEMADFSILKNDDPLVGSYAELAVGLRAEPPAGASERQFLLFFDAIMHQIVTHQAILSVKQDWENGIHAEQKKQLAVIQTDAETGKILPISIDLEVGSRWKGFAAMIDLGRRHISEGTDHLLFLMLLLIVVPLVRAGKKWGAFGGWRRSFLQTLKTVTAFTVGHSATLAVCSLGFLNFPSRWIEILIGFSILVSALNAARPIFLGREIWVAMGFGLVHGMAFSNTLAGFELEKTELVLSILGFNLGIEWQQLLIVFCSVPLLFLFSRSRFYGIFRWAMAAIGAVAATAWMAERFFQKPNAIAAAVDRAVDYPFWFLGLLAAFSMLGFWKKD